MRIIEWENLNKSFGETKVLLDMSGGIEEGEITLLSGVSGSGKSTLLNILGLLEPHDDGVVSWWGEKNVKPFSRKAEKLLANRIGYLFQNFALIDHLTVEKNLSIALEMSSGSESEKDQEMREALQVVGLPETMLEQYVYQCSGGEQQRIAIARLLLKPCDLILCDEPTGSLDEVNRDIVIELLLDLNREGKTIVIATHDPSLKAIADQVIQIPMLRVPATTLVAGWTK
ncbi:MAG TPA: ATP-binding cassette domain-containing protein [Oscillospiraceae bacterium]|nr:ATP-binding cassette domain-containing protein [Oscillospiraceae bacterium]